MADVTTIEEIYAFVRALVANAVRCWEEKQETTSLYTHCVSLSNRPVDGNGGDRLDVWRCRLEAIELLALLRVVDPASWARILGQIGFSNIGRCLRDHQQPAYDIAFAPDDSIEFMDSVLSLVVAPSTDRVHTQPFLNAKSHLLAMARDPEVLAAVCGMRIPIRILDGDGREETSELFRRWLELGTNSPLPSSSFVLASVLVRPGRSRVTPTFIDKVHHYVTAHAALDEVVLTVRPRDEPPSRLRTGQFLSDVVGSRGATSVRCSRLDHRLTREAFLSVLLGPAATGPRSLHIANLGSGDSVAGRCSYVLWILYGLFSQDARHSIHTLFFPVFTGTQAHELEWLHNLLQTQPAPRMELLIPEAFDEYVSCAPPTTDRWVTVPRGCPIRLEEREDWQSHALRFDDQDKNFRVIRDDPTWRFLDILVPGYGRCWVERREDVSAIDKPLTPWRFDQHTVHSLEIAVLHVSDDEQRAVDSFLRLVGIPIQTLRIHRMWRDDEPPSGICIDLLSAMLHHCPHLKRLILHGVSPVDSDALLKAFEYQRMSLQGLGFETQPFVDRSEFVRFLEMLCDPTLAITQKLRELAVDLHHYEDERTDSSDVVEAVLRVLETNNSLRVVHVGLSVAQQERYGSRFHAHCERFISSPKAPVSMRAKCALLSVVGTAGMPIVETVLLTHVFAFAAECETRVVTVGACSPNGYISGRQGT